MHVYFLRALVNLSEGFKSLQRLVRNHQPQRKMRESPNIIVTGTPGVGKTTHCEILAEKTGLRHVSVNQVVKDRECHEGWSDEYHSWIVDEDKVSATTVTENECEREN